MSGDIDAPQSGITARVAVILGAGLLFAYPFWVALGNLLNVPDYLQSQFGATPAQIPWVLLVSDVARPVLIFLGGVVLLWKRGAGAMALVLTTGFAVVNATALSTLAFEKEVELRLVIDFLTGS
jgi:hypothetical protein